MKFYFFLIPLFGALVGWGIAMLLARLFTRKVEGADVNADVDLLLDQHLDTLVETLKVQIPMSGMFLTGTIVDKLKWQAKVQFLKMIPQLKQKLIARYITGNDTTIQLWGAGCGFVLGLLQVVVVRFC